VETDKDSPLTAEQIRAARRLLGWTTSKLATRVGVTEKTVRAFETGEPWSSPLNLDLVRERLEAADIEFIAGSVVLRKEGRARRGRGRGRS
jgi:transcriptional regulator with XRE-family HTH domain